MSRRMQTVLVLAAAVAALASVAAAATLLLRIGPSSAVMLGEEIFSGGKGPTGRPIARSGGIFGLAVGGCASCHGRDGHGLPALGGTPDITYANLTDPQGMRLPDGRRGPLFTDQSIRLAVAAGVDPLGSALSAAMPHWQLTGREWAGLLAYIKTLK